MAAGACARRSGAREGRDASLRTDFREDYLQTPRPDPRRRLAHVVAVQVLELREIEARRRPSDAAEIEGLDHLLGGENFLVAVAPAEADEIVAQRDRQIAESPVGIDAERAVTLRELRAVRPMDQRDMRHLGTSQPNAW